MLFLHFGGPCDSIVVLGAHFATLGDLFLHVFRTWWDLGAQFVDLGACSCTFGVHFGVFLWLCDQILGPFFGFSGNASKKGKKEEKKLSLIHI